jgi:hypothetical protein
MTRRPTDRADLVDQLRALQRNDTREHTVLVANGLLASAKRLARCMDDRQREIDRLISARRARVSA